MGCLLRAAHFYGNVKFVIVLLLKNNFLYFISCFNQMNSSNR